MLPQLNFADLPIVDIKFSSAKMSNDEANPWIIEVIEVEYEGGSYEVYSRSHNLPEKGIVGEFKYAYGHSRGNRDKRKKE